MISYMRRPVHRAGQAARLLDEVTRERGIGWPYFHVVDVAVKGLVQSTFELCHATKPPTQVLQNSLRRRCTVRMDTICASVRCPAKADLQTETLPILSRVAATAA